MLPTNPKSYSDLLDRFSWSIPPTFNIGHACSDAVAARFPDRVAILDDGKNGPRETTFKSLADHSTRFAAALDAIGVSKGDRVAIMLPQSAEAAIAHLGIYKLGAIAVPLAMQFGPGAMQHRLSNSGAKAIIADKTGLERLASIKHQLPDLCQAIAVGSTEIDALNFFDLIAAGSPRFQTQPTLPDDPSMMLFTSGTTGLPKGTLHGHRVLLGHLPGIQMAHNFLPMRGDVFWTPSDWAWAGGLLNALLPALYFGVTVVAARAPKFEPEWAVDLIRKTGVRNIFMPPTALKLMQPALNDIQGINLRSVACAGEALGKQTHIWAQEAMGIAINEFYGQTECNAIIGSCDALGIGKAGSMGKAVPGHEVAILDEKGNVLPDGITGTIAIKKNSPVMFLNYHNDVAGTDAKFSGDWLVTGDLGYRDDEGYFHFVSRNDDIITSAGYRIGPVEIEDCLRSHPAVELAAAVGQPDKTRTEIVAAYIKLQNPDEASPELQQDIRRFVKTRLSAHEYPRSIKFVDHIPLTESGKIIRRHFKQ